MLSVALQMTRALQSAETTTPASEVVSLAGGIPDNGAIMSSPPPGSYTKTAKDVAFSSDGTLTAQLQKMDGSWVGASYKYDLSNQNGVFYPLPAGNYNLTSRNVTVENRPDGPYLVAECQKIDGTWVSSSLKLPFIENINGVLKNTH